ncbi:unnamed protein product [Durusdinium trenchii]|uniref:C2 domain-containing protein n=1 Tax=Durusdinium trenchii TaxID=1381693 RepID=A0ABP0NYV5_9DINO
MRFESQCSTIQEEELTWTQWFQSLQGRCFSGLHSCWPKHIALSPRRRWQQAKDFLLPPPAEDASEHGQAYGLPSWLGPKHEFINDLLEAQWPYISQWFEDAMRLSCEPALQHLMPPGITISFGERCTLGTKPAILEQIVASKFWEEDGTTIRLDAQLNYRGDCHVDVTCTVGSLELTRLEVKGQIIIELVRLRKQPPWFSGVRIYFSNRPTIDLVLQTQLFGVDANFAFIKQKIVDALTKVISNQAVLPHRFSIPMGEGIRLMDLKSPTPQGVLRLLVLEAKGLPDPSRSNWSNLMLRIGWQKAQTEADPFAEVTIGAQVQKTGVVARSRAPQWTDGQAFDFVIEDPKLQNLYLALRDNDTGALGWNQNQLLGSAEKKLTQLLEGQHLDQGLPELWLPLGGFASAKLRAEWRPLSTGTEGVPTAGHVPLHPTGSWSIGPKNQHEWLLVVDTLSASALPKHGLGLNHWVKLSIQFDGAEKGSYATGAAVGAGPVEHGQQMLEHMGLRPEIRQVLQSHPERIYSLWRSQVSAAPAAVEMEQKGNTVYGLTGPPVFVDAVWNHNERILVDSLPSMSLVLTVHRTEKGQRNMEDGSVLGSASMNLEELLKVHQGRYEGLLPLGKDKEALRTLAHLQVRLRLHALAPPPAPGSRCAAKAPSSRTREHFTRQVSSKWYDAVSAVSQDGFMAKLRSSWSFGPRDAPSLLSPGEPGSGLHPTRPAAASGGFVAKPPLEPKPSGAVDRSQRYVRRNSPDREEYHEVLEDQDHCDLTLADRIRANVGRLASG